jgi:hypothetical protein
MRRLIAAVGSIWAVFAIALVLAFGQQHTGAPQASSSTALVVVRQANGTLKTVPAVVHASTQTSGSVASGQAAASSLNGQLVSSTPTVSSHATTRSS